MIIFDKIVTGVKYTVKIFQRHYNCVNIYISFYLIINKRKENAENGAESF